MACGLICSSRPSLAGPPAAFTTRSLVDMMAKCKPALPNAQVILSPKYERVTYTLPVDLFAKRFKQARESAKLRQEDVAAVCVGKDGEPISRVAVAQWEKPNSPTRPTVDNLAAAAKRMGASVDYLMGLSDDPKGAVGLSDDALQVARVWDGLPASVKDDVLHALQWSVTQKNKARKDALSAILDTVKDMKK